MDNPKAAQPQETPAAPAATFPVQSTPPSSGEPPKPAEVAPATAPEVPEGSDESSDFLAAAGLDDTPLEEEEGGEDIPPDLSAESTPPAPAVQPSEEAPVAPVVEPPAPAATEEAPKPAETPAEPPTTEVVAEPAKPAAATDWPTLRTEGQKILEKVYKDSVTQEDKEVFGEDMAERIPVHFAKLHMNIYESVMNAVHSVLPDIIRSVQQADQARGAFDAAFFKQFPGLKAYTQDVEKAKAYYGAMNPQAKAEDAIRDIGIQLSLKHKLPLPAAFVPGAAPVVETPAEPVVPAFSPAVPGGAGNGSGRSSSSGNVFSTLIEDEE